MNNEYKFELNEMAKDFYEEEKYNCNKTEKLLDSKLNISTNVYASVISDHRGYTKVIVIDIFNNYVDYRTVTIDYNKIEKDINEGIPFENAIYDIFIDTLINHPKTIEIYKGNIWEKLTDCFLRNSSININNQYYILDHELYKQVDKENSDEIVYFDDVEHIEFISENEVIIYCGEDFQKIVIDDNGVHRLSQEEN